MSPGTLTSGTVGLTTCKSQLSTAQTQSPTTTPTSTNSSNPSNILLHASTPSGIYLTNSNVS